MDILNALRDVKKNKIAIRKSSLSYFDIRDLYWYSVGAEECPKLSLVYKRGRGEGVEYIDFKTKKIVYPTDIKRFVDVREYPFVGGDGYRISYKVLSVCVNRPEWDNISEGEWSFKVDGYYEVCSKGLYAYDTTYRTCEGIAPLSEKAKICQYRDGANVHPLGLIDVCVDGIKENGGIAFREDVLDNCVKGINQSIKDKYNNCFKIVQERNKNIEAKKEKTKSAIKEAKDNLYR